MIALAEAGYLADAIDKLDGRSVSKSPSPYRDMAEPWVVGHVEFVLTGMADDASAGSYQSRHESICGMFWSIQTCEECNSVSSALEVGTWNRRSWLGLALDFCRLG